MTQELMNIESLQKQISANLSPGMQKRLAEVENGVKGGSDSFPRMSMDRSKIVIKAKGETYKHGSEFHAILLGATGVVGRDFNPNTYDPKNPQPPHCVSLDGKVPFAQFKGTPLVVDRSGGPKRRATTCAECPESPKGQGCDYWTNTVWALIDDVSVTGLFHMQIRNASLFNDGDLVDNDPNLNVGYLEYAKKLNQIMIGDNPMRSFQIVTRISVFEQKEQGYAMAYGIGADESGLMLNSPEILDACMNLIKTPEYKEMLNSHWMPEDSGTKAVPENKFDDEDVMPEHLKEETVEEAQATETVLEEEPEVEEYVEALEEANDKPAELTTDAIYRQLVKSGALDTAWTDYFRDFSGEELKAAVLEDFAEEWDAAIVALTPKPKPKSKPKPASKPASKPATVGDLLDQEGATESKPKTKPASTSDDASVEELEMLGDVDADLAALENA